MTSQSSSSTDPITSKDQLIAYFKHAEKPKANWLIGSEQEKFPFRLSSLKPVSYEEPNGLRDLFIALGDYGWRPIMDKDTLIGLSRGQATLSFEPGGQVELSGTPLPNLHEVSSEIDQHLMEICEIGERLDIGFLGMGFHPSAKRNEIPWTPLSRYAKDAENSRHKIMQTYMSKQGSLGLDMMLRTCSTQVNLDFSSESDMARKFRTALTLQPIATALFSTSSIYEGKSSEFNCFRMHVWSDTDQARSGAPQCVYEENFNYERYVDYALDVPMYYVFRDNQYVDCAGQSFRDFMLGELPAMPRILPTLGDWTNHLSTLFPDVRLKNVIELRGADSGPAEMQLALPSFWVGLLYDQIALEGACTVIKDWTIEDCMQLHADVPRYGLLSKIRGQTLQNIAETILGLSKQGLRRRALRLHGGADESRYIDILFSITDSQHNLADEMLMQLTHFDNFSMKNIFELCRLKAPPKTPYE